MQETAGLPLNDILIQITQGFSYILPEIICLLWIIIGIFAELFLHSKSRKFASSWRYFIAQIGLGLALLLAFQRMYLGLQGFVSFQLFAVNPTSNILNVVILVMGLLLLILNQTQQKSFSKIVIISRFYRNAHRTKGLFQILHTRLDIAS